MIKNLSLIPLLILVSACQDGLLDELREGNSAEFCAGARDAQDICTSEVRPYGWSFKDPNNYNYDSNFIEITGNKASVKSFDSEFSGNDFLEGNHAGTSVNNGQLGFFSKEQSSLDIRQILKDSVDDLVGYWRFEGDFTNSVNNSDTPSVGSGASTSSVNSKVGAQSGLFDGAGSSQVSVSNIHNRVASIKQGSAMAWVKADSVAGRFFEIRYDANNYIQLLFSSTDKIRLVVEFNNSYKFCDYTLSPNLLDEWIHVAGTWNGDNANADGTLYINGQGACVLGDAGTSPVGAATAFSLVNSLYDGQLDEYAYFTTELTSADVNKVYETQRLNSSSHSEQWTPSWDSLVGLWSFEGHFNDSSGNGNNLETVGAGAEFYEGKVGTSSAYFSGGRFEFNNTSNYANGFAIGGWIKADKSGAWQTIITKGDGTNLGLQLTFQSNDTFLCRFINSSTSKAVSDSVGELDHIGVWRHVICSFDPASQSINLYIDSKLVRTTPTAGLTPPSTTDKITIASSSFLGNLDELGIWNTTLSGGDVVEIFNRQKQKYGASYESPVFNLGSSVSWTNLMFKTPLPFMKEITAVNGSESTVDYPSIVGDLSSGLVGYWPINESVANSVSGEDIRDHSTYGNHGNFENSPEFVQGHVFSNALKFDRTNDDALNFGSSPSLDFTGDFTVSFWMKASSYPNVSQDYLIGKGDYNDNGWVIGFIGTAGACGSLDGALYLADGTASYKVCSSKALPLNQWINVQMVYSGTTVTFYVNGEVYANQTGINIPFNDTLDLIAGKRSANSWHYSGLMDEIAIWNRALTSDELNQLYRRGANRVKFQVRSCDDSLCDDEAWIGPDGTNTTYFSEFINNDLIDGSGLPVGDVKTAAADILFSDFVSQAASNKYFQYRVLLESEDNDLCSGEPCFPELSSVELSPNGRYFGGLQMVEPKQPLSLRKIKAITISEEGSCSSRFQLSRDGVNYYYYDSGSWKLAGTASNSNPAQTLNDYGNAFSVQIPGNKLYLRAFLQTDTSTSCAITDITVEGY
ncbi:MAG: LamG domain-containing protein [Bacteriovoracaceae bacterium]|nr:LamG domain-containing protein [Bacteriovoracaceae bacterium]